VVASENNPAPAEHPANFLAGSPQGLALVTEAHRDLLEQGWQRRFVTAGHRAVELAALYDELGFEVHLEPVRAEDLPEACTGCRAAALFHFVTLYTRR
jgi:hypothetical protein